MKRYILQITSCVLLLGLLSSMISPLTYAASASDTTVQQIIKDINAFRSKHGKGSVTYHQGYADFAQKAAEYTAKNQGSGHARLDGTYWINDFFNQFKPTAAFEDITWGSGANSTLGWIHETGNIDPTHPYGHCESLLYGDPYSVGIGVSSNVVFLDGSAGSMSSTTPEICKILHNATDTDVKNYLYSSNPTLITPKTTQVYTLNAGITEAQFLTDIAARAIDTIAKPLSITSNFSTVVNQAVAGTYTVTLTAKDSLSRTTTKTVNITVRSTPTPLPTPTLTISKTTLSLTKGQSETLIATVTPVSTPVTYTTNNSAVATVTNSGQVTATGLGTTTLTAKISAYGQTVTKTITVTVSAGEFINIPDANLKACINETLKQDATASITKEQALTLKTLNCRNKGITSLEGLENFTNLSWINVAVNPFSSVLPLSGLTKLESLYIEESNVQDISSLSKLVNLINFSLSETKVSDISVVSNYKNLTTLLIIKTPIQSIEALRNITTIETISMINTLVSDISPLSKLTNIKFLNASSSKIKDISSLENLLKIESLYLNDTNISSIDSLKNLLKIERLSLKNTNISSIDPLKNLLNINFLDISDNPIKSIQPLTNLTKLVFFYANDTLVNDISPISNTKLYDLRIRNAKLSSIKPLSNQEISYTDLYGNQITDFSPLKKSPSSSVYISNQAVNLNILPQKSELKLRSPSTGAPFTIKNIIGESAIDENGTLHFTSVGEHTIEYYSGTQLIGTIRVTTVNPILTFPSKILSLPIKSTKQLEPKTIPNQIPVTYISNNPNIVTVSNDGKVNAISYGKTTITAQMSVQGEIIKEEILVNVDLNYINIPDPALKACISNTAYGNGRMEISQFSAELFTSLNCSNLGIVSLQGLEYFKNIHTLNLDQNYITDISPLTSLTSLKYLYLSNQSISNVTALANKNIHYLSLLGNQITDFSGINNIPTSISRTTQNVKLGSIPQETEIILKEYGTGLPFTIQNKIGTAIIDSKGTLHFTSEGEHKIEYYNGTQLIGTIHAITTLPTLTISEKEITLSKDQIKTLTAETTSTSPIIYTSNNPNIATINQKGQVVGINTGTTTLTATILINNLPITRTLLVTVIDSITINDINLKTCINEALGQSSSTPITKAQALSITSLRCPNRRIKSLQGLEVFKNISELTLYTNSIEDISPLKYLLSLNKIDIRDNKLKDISVFEGKQFNSVYIGGNQISDFSFLKNPLPNFNLNIQQINLGIISNDAQLTIREPFTGAPFTIHNIIGSSTIDENGILRFTSEGDHKIEFYNGNKIMGKITATTITPSISFSKEPFRLSTNETKKVFPTILPSETPITYSSFNTHIASITNNGQITGHNPGTTTVKAQINIGDKIITKTLTVVVSNSITIPDTALKTCINESRGKDASDPISIAEALSITSLKCEKKGISNLEGIENFKNISVLNLSNNSIESVVSLKYIPLLQDLDISNNKIKDISPFTNKFFNVLKLSYNQITDFYGFKLKTSMFDPDIARIEYQTVTLGTISQETQIKLRNYVTGNSFIIKNITGTATIDDSGTLRFTSSGEHVINFYSGIQYIGTITATTTTPSSYPTLSLSQNKVSIARNQTEQLIAFATSYTGESPMVTFKSSNTTVAKVSKTGKITGINPGTTIITAETTFDGKTASQSATIIVKENSEYINIPDTKLKACLNNTFNQSIGSQITKTQALLLKELNCSNNDISSMQGLEEFENLEKLELNHNKIENLTTISSLLKLTYLNLSDNLISSITPLQKLVNLSSLVLSDNNIDDITPLSKFTYFYFLDLNTNMIKDILPLTNLRSVTYLYLNNNLIDDITPLKNIKYSKFINLSLNNIRTIYSLPNYTDYLNLNGNQVTDFSLIKNSTPITTFLNQKVELNTISQATQLILKDTITGTPFTIKNIIGTSSIDANGVLSFTSVGTHTIEFYSGLQRIGTITATTF